MQRNVEHYSILQINGHHSTQSDEEDRNLFIYTKSALNILGFSNEKVVDIFRIIAVILKLGNLQFVPCNNIDGTDGCVICNEYGKLIFYCCNTGVAIMNFSELFEICELLGAEHRWLHRALTTRQIENGILTDLNACEASKLRDVLCRTLYSRTFSWLINKINELLKVNAFIYFSLI